MSGLNLDRVVFSRPTDGFSPLHSSARLRRLYNILFNNPASPTEVQCLVLIGGADSRDDPWHAALLAYLLAGCAPHAPKTDAVAALLEDAVVVLGRTGVGVWSSSATSSLVAYITSAWPCARHFCPGAGADEAQAEEHKVFSFREMLAPYSVLGTVLAAPAVGSARQGPTAAVERWPLVQSFAADEGGARPFLTMAKDVVDVTAAFVAAGASGGPPSVEWGLRDAHTVAAVALGGLTAVRAQWGALLVHASQLAADAPTATDTIDAANWLERLAEPLALYSRHAAIGHNSATAGLDRATAVAPARASFGRGPAGGDAVVVSFDDPASLLRVTRTLFLTLADGAGAGSGPSPLRAAVRAYAAAIDAVASGGPWADEMSLRAGVAAALAGSVAAAPVVTVAPLPGGGLVYVAVEDPVSGVTYGDTFLALRSGSSSNAGTATAATMAGCAWLCNATRTLAPLEFFERRPERRALAARWAAFVAAEADCPPSQRAARAEAASAASGRKSAVVADSAQAAFGAPGLGPFLGVVDAADGVAVRVFRAAGGGESAATAGALLLSVEQPTVAAFGGGFIVLSRRLGFIGPLLFSAAAGGGVAGAADTTAPLTLVFRPSTAAVAALILGDGAEAVEVSFLPSSQARGAAVREFLPGWREAGWGSFVDRAVAARADGAGGGGADGVAAPRPTPRRTSAFGVAPATAPSALFLAGRAADAGADADAGDWARAAAKDAAAALRFYHGPAAAAALAGGVFSAADAAPNRLPLAPLPQRGPTAATATPVVVEAIVVSGHLSAGRHRFVRSLLRSLGTLAAGAAVGGALRFAVVPAPPAVAADAPPGDNADTGVAAFAAGADFDVAAVAAGLRALASGVAPGGRAVAVVVPPPSFPIAHACDALAAAADAAGVAVSVVRSVSVVAAAQYFLERAPPAATIVAPYMREVTTPGWFDVLLVHTERPVAGAGGVAATAYGAAMAPALDYAPTGDPALVGHAERSVRDAAVVAGAPTPPFRAVYSFAEAVLAALEPLSRDASATAEPTALARLAPWRAAAFFPRRDADWQPAFRVREFSFARLHTTDPLLMDFVSFVGTSSAARLAATPLAGLVLAKGYVNVDGREAEVTVFPRRAQLRRYAVRRVTGAVRHSQRWFLVFARPGSVLAVRSNPTPDARRAGARPGAASVRVSGEGDDGDDVNGDAKDGSGNGGAARFLARALGSGDSILQRLVSLAGAAGGAAAAAVSAGGAGAASGARALKITRASLQPSDIADIIRDAQNRHIPLPLGWGLETAEDGTQVYAAADGRRSAQRPDADALVDAFLARVNGEAPAVETDGGGRGVAPAPAAADDAEEVTSDSGEGEGDD